MSVSARPARPPYGPIATLALTVALCVWLAVSQLCVGFLLRRWLPHLIDPPAQLSDGGPAGIMLWGSALAVSLAIAALIKLRAGPSVSSYLALQRCSGRALLLAAGLAALAALLIDLWLWLVDRPLTHPSMLRMLHTAGGLLPLLAAGVLLAAPLSEELLFRGFCYRGLLASPLHPAWTALLTSALWSLLHVQYGWQELVALLATGVMLGELRRRTGSLWPPLLCHALVNLIAGAEALAR